MSGPRAVEASCHCGRATIELPRLPDRVVQCNCSLCTLMGLQSMYFAPDELRIEGQFDDYVRDDVVEPKLRLFRCARCGTATHWEPLTRPPHERIGVNANLLGPERLKPIEIARFDGRAGAK